MSGKLIVISGPSGVGKGTVASALEAADPRIKISVSATTRQPRKGDIHGVNYFFLSKDEFEQMIDRDEFLEYAEYVGNYYGSPKKQAELWMAQGKDVILEIEVQGCKKIKENNPECISIFIMPPSMEVLEHRLRKRATDSEESILKRLSRAREEIRLARDYDYIIVNDGLSECIADVKTVLKAEKLRADRFDVSEMLS